MDPTNPYDPNNAQVFQAQQPLQSMTGRDPSTLQNPVQAAVPPSQMDPMKMQMLINALRGQGQGQMAGRVYVPPTAAQSIASGIGNGMQLGKALQSGGMITNAN